MSDTYIMADFNTDEQPHRKILSEAECLEIGGHCFVESDVTYLTNPPQFSRICKHCGHRQYGRKQEPIAWEDKRPVKPKEGGAT